MDIKTKPEQDDEIYDHALREIASYVLNYQIDRPNAWARARLALLDALGCALHTLYLSPECRKLIGPIVPGITVTNGFKLPGTSHQLDPLKGAFDLGSLVRYLDQNDAYAGAEWGHPSDNLGAILALSDWLSRSSSANATLRSPTPFDSAGAQIPLTDYSGTTPRQMTLQTVLIAQIKAYEIQGSLQQLNSFNSLGFDHTILVKIASTAVACWLLGLSENAILAALSHAFQDGPTLRTFRQAPNAGPRKGWAAGDACMRAVQLAFLAKTGQPGAPSALRDPKWGFYARFLQGGQLRLERPYETHVVERVGFKLVACEGHAISAVEAAVLVAQAMRGRDLNVEKDVRTIHIRTQKPAYVITNKTGPLRNAADRDHCLQYIVAVTMLKGDAIAAEDYADASPWATSPAVDALRAKMQVLEDERFTADYNRPGKRSVSNAITVVLASGEELDEVVVEYPLGHPDRMDTTEQVQLKFRRNAGLCFSEDRIEEILKVVENDDMPVHEFLDLFATKHPGDGSIVKV